MPTLVFPSKKSDHEKSGDDDLEGLGWIYVYYTVYIYVYGPYMPLNCIRPYTAAFHIRCSLYPARLYVRTCGCEVGEVQMAPGDIFLYEWLSTRLGNGSI